MSSVRSKAELRTELRERLAALSSDVRQANDAEICRRIVALPEYESASQVLAFVPMNDEPDIAPVLIRAVGEGRRVYAPLVEGDSRLRFVRWSPENVARALKYGRWEASGDEPPGSDVSVVLVPARAIDENGYRLGRGRGCYDRSMRSLRAMGSTIGVIYGCQLLDYDVPREQHDERVDWVVTETRAIRCSVAER